MGTGTVTSTISASAGSTFSVSPMAPMAALCSCPSGAVRSGCTCGPGPCSAAQMHSKSSVSVATAFVEHLKKVWLSGLGVPLDCPVVSDSSTKTSKGRVKLWSERRLVNEVDRRLASSSLSSLIFCVSSLLVTSSRALSASSSTPREPRGTGPAGPGFGGAAVPAVPGTGSLSFSVALVPLTTPVIPARGGVAGAAHVGSGAQTAPRCFTTRPGDCAAGTTIAVAVGGDKLGEDTWRRTLTPGL
mmetsp:Transcript_73321/g.161924  ORF Transcript_73321/g.161924 Transcript_73321/m.161924 type:complete len:244 (-) Transcript_73321:66-797(-)